MRHELWSGWGVRTMAKTDAAYNPLSYHNGTVWPHDTALAAWGLARYGLLGRTSHRSRAALIEAARHFDCSLPEVFAGFARAETPFPIAYPTAARPQAWAAGAPILLLRSSSGCSRIRARAGWGRWKVQNRPPVIDIILEGVRALGRTWDVIVRRGRVRESRS